jgi:hypothetical protein
VVSRKKGVLLHSRPWGGKSLLGKPYNEKMEDPGMGLFTMVRDDPGLTHHTVAMTAVLSHC